MELVKAGAQVMNVLLIGGGGREHALAWKLKQSAGGVGLFLAPGNAGMAALGTCVALDVSDFAQVAQFCHEHAIELVVVGPEKPLVDGLVDFLAARGIAAFGPSWAAARLEGSKHFTKALCRAHRIPTARYRHFDNAAEAKDYVRAQGAPIVVKADGLAAGKGVSVAESVAEAEAAIDACFAGAFGEAGAEVIIEECLQGEEASFFVLTDGEHILPLASAQDHKRAFDGDKGPNTGGMGAYSPAPVMDAQMTARVMEEIIEPTIEAMAAQGTPYRGVLYAGLMITSEGPKLIEYNVRFGDPECQVLMMRLRSDLLPLLHATAVGRLDTVAAEFSEDAALTVVMAAQGYPGAYEKGSLIVGLEAAAAGEGVEIFHAGTARGEDGAIIAAGGRVLNVTARGESIAQAQARAYQAVRNIDWPEGAFRTDIGWRALAREQGPKKT